MSTTPFSSVSHSAEHSGQNAAPMFTSSLLLEIGTEEIPARFIPPALIMLKSNTESIFEEYSIGFSGMNAYATPRRLALLVKGIPPMQKDRVKEVYGPAKKAAFDEHGAPTRAAAGFAQSQGIDVNDLVVKKKEKGEYVVAVIHYKGAPVMDLLHEALKKVILSLNFPKSMRWGNGDLRFVRPIHWIMALLDGTTIIFEIDGLRSGNITKGHRFLSPGSFIVKEIPSYINLLENNYVIADIEERKRKIAKGIENLAVSVAGKALRDEELFNTVTNLVEYPVPVLCEFPPEYLRLPKELLITVMKDHQKYFAIENDHGNLKNYFVVISNTKDENKETIRKGAERVIKARFEDARFYYEEDIKRTLHSRIQDLKRVTFHDKLGSLYDKTRRVVTLASFLSEILLPHVKQSIERAAWLCKTDLITGVVREFPELQGLMGKYYAVHDGEEHEVAEAIVQQYFPSHSGDRLPENDMGALLSLSDKIDNIVSFFGVDLVPTGSEDPFALRRQALAVIAILMEKGYPVALRELIAKAEENVLNKRTSLLDEVLRFFAQRIEPLFSLQHYDSDTIQSVLPLMESVPIAEMKERMNALKRFTADDGYTPFLLAMKRIHNIVPKADVPALKPEVLSEEQEKSLYSELHNMKPAFNASLKNKEYYDAIKRLSTLTETINSFFDKVLVMDKREEVKLNRFALLHEIGKMGSLIADFSKLKENR
ncbi:MAG TPA: glycine--tRNA ligase subunit beta [Thermodesulfovibrionales bacterium]|nr:glycine--tRNA ligase subunit beta [Thermodesulfovibrionales bacterium]